MSVKRGNLRADTVVKNYWRNNEQFADFFNAVLFDGEQVIKPDEDNDDALSASLREFAKGLQSDDIS